MKNIDGFLNVLHAVALFGAFLFMSSLGTILVIHLWRRVLG